MKNITASILISNFNHSKFLNRCLDSIVNQTRTPDEVIIIDDYSTDNSRDILKEYASNYEFIKIIFNNNNLGPVANANTLIRLSSSDYIIMTGADDFLKEDYLEKSLNLLRNNPYAGLCASLPGYIEDGSDVVKLNKKYYIPNTDKSSGYVEPKKLLKLLKNRNFNINGNTCILKRNACIEFNMLDENLKWHSDFLLYYAIAGKYGICFVPEIISIYRSSNNSYSSKKYLVNDKVNIIIKILDALDNPPFSEVKLFFKSSGILAGMPGKFGIPGIFFVFILNRKYWKYFTFSLLRHLIKGVVICMWVKIKIHDIKDK
jgi:glycosyltransferase involved in cell wall biosynthesis